MPKGLNEHFDPSAPSKMFREASWEEAMELAVGGLKKIKQELGGAGLAGFGSAKGSNEEAYLFQKLVRVGFGINNVDHCTRLCHAATLDAWHRRVQWSTLLMPKPTRTSFWNK